RLADGRAVREHVDDGRARQCPARGAVELRAHAVVVRVEQHRVALVERAIVSQPHAQHEGLEEPRDVGEMPFGRADIGHRLDDIVLDGQRLAEALGDPTHVQVAFEQARAIAHRPRINCNARASEPPARWYPPGMKATGFQALVESDRGTFEVQTAAAGPAGRLPLTAEMLLERPSGDVFGLTQNAGMGWDPRELGRPQFLMLGTNGGLRAADGRPIALGYHTGHWEIGLLMQAAAEELVAQECLPFAAFCSDPCDGRTQGTVGMMDSLAY